MIHDGRRAERKGQTGCPQPPAHVNVVSRRPEVWIETAQSLERSLSKSHVAARDMLRFGVCDHYMRRSPGRICNAIGHHVAGRGPNVWAARPGAFAVVKGERKVFQPMRIGPGIVVYVGNDLAGSGFQAGVASGGESGMCDGN